MARHLFQLTYNFLCFYKGRHPETLYVVDADGQRANSEEYLAKYLENRVKTQNSLKKDCTEGEGYIIWLNFEGTERSLNLLQCKPPLVVDLTTAGPHLSSFTSKADVIARIARNMQTEVISNVTGT